MNPTIRVPLANAMAAHLAEHHGFHWVRADVVRKELAGLDPGDDGSAGFDQGLYRPEHTERTYAECLSRAVAVVASGGRAVIDASFGALAHRVQVRRAAIEHGLRPEVWLCTAPAAASLARMASRPAGPSDADADVYRRAAQRFADDETSLRLSTAGSLAQTLARLDQQLQEVGWAT